MSNIRISLIVLLIMCCSSAHAEFYKLNSLTYAAPDQRTGVILTTGQDKTGVFVIVSDKPVSVQALNPKREAGTSVFLQYDPSAGRYTKLILGEGKGQEFLIQGNLSLVLTAKDAKVRIAIDHTGSTSYLTVVTQQGQTSSILGLAGNQPILNLSGEVPVSLLEANKLQSQHQDLHPYEVKASQSLFLDGRRFSGKGIGVELNIESLCLQSGVSIYESDTANQRKTNVVQMELLRPSSMANYLVLNVLDNDLVALNFVTGRFGVIRTSERNAKSVCIFTASDLAQK